MKYLVVKNSNCRQGYKVFTLLLKNEYLKLRIPDNAYVYAMQTIIAVEV